MKNKVLLLRIVDCYSLQTVSQLVGAAGPQLKPHLPLLIPALLQATGELEASKFSHLSTMLSAHSQAQEMIDSARASAAKSHYTTETMTRVCILSSSIALVDKCMDSRVLKLKNKYF